MKSNSNVSGCSLRGILVVAGGILVHLSIGSYYTFGNIAPYMISYLRNRTDDVSIRNVDGLWITALGGIGNCVGMSGGGILDKRFGPRIATAVGSLVFSSAIALTSLTLKKAFIYVVMTYGVMSTLGITAAYGPAVQTSIKWFPKHPSLAAGLIVAGFGGGALIFNQVVTNYINPDNLPPDLTTQDGEKYFTDPDLLDRVPTCLLILAASYVAMQIIGIALITTPPQNYMAISVAISSEEHGVKNEGFSGDPVSAKTDTDISVIYHQEPNGTVVLSEKEGTSDKKKM